MTGYHKTLSPPEGELFLETSDGLKYWLVLHGPKLGCQASVLTEDESISMHSYGGWGRGDGGAYLFCFQGFQIGFVLHEMNGQPLPQYEPRPEYDEEKGELTEIVTAIGVPVWDEHAIMVLDRKGRYVKGKYGRKTDSEARRAGKGYVTGLSWKEYYEGKRDRFKNRTQQEAMLTIWPDLFTGLSGKFERREKLELQDAVFR